MTFVSPRVHGVLDYLFAALFLLAPFLLDFRSDAASSPPSCSAVRCC